MNKLELKMKHRTISLLDKYFTGESIDFKQMFAIIMPIFVDQAFLIFMSLLNTAMISAAGVAAVRAVSMVDSLNIFLVNVFIAVATGGTVIVAQYKGSGNPEMVSKKPCHFFFPRSLIIKNSSILFIKGTFVFMI